MEGVLALVRLYQRYTFSLNEQRHGGRPLEHESLITLTPKVSCALPHLMSCLLLKHAPPALTVAPLDPEKTMASGAGEPTMKA